MTSATYLKLKYAIENVLQASAPLPAEPNGEHYYAFRRPTNKYLVELGVLSAARQIRLDELHPRQHQRYKKTVWLVNYARAEQMLDRLTQIERKLGTPDERYKNREHFVRRLQSLRVDLEDVR